MEFLRGDIRNDTVMRDGIATQLNKLRMDLHSPPRIAVYQEAELQKKDIRKQVLATVAAPIVVWMAVCMGLAWLEYRQRKIHTAGEVATGLGIRVVGAIPKLHNLERHLIGAGDLDMEGHTILESINAIRTLLLHDAASQGTRVVMVTSAVEGEGKTTLAAHLASSLARAGRKTLLVDADLRQPAVHQLFELPLQPGFSEVLLGEVEVVDSVQATTLDGLSVITAGQWDREVILSLARDGVEGIFERLREEFDFIIVDSHPVLSATDSLLVGQQADAVLLSVMRQLSQMPRVYGAAQRLTALKIRVLGAVVNGADVEEVVPTVESPGALLEQR
jgi:capsular exopolysaccharide synthesis family protein